MVSLKNAFESIKQSAVTLFTNPVGSFLSGAAAVGAAFSQPIATIKNVSSEGLGKGLVDSINETAQRPLVSNIARVVGTGATLAAGVVAAGAIAGSATAESILSTTGAVSLKALKAAGQTTVSLAKANPVTSLVVAASLPAAATVLATSPTARNAVGTLVNPLAENKLNFAQDLANVIEGKQSIGSFVSDHAIGTSALVGGTAVALGALPIVATGVSNELGRMKLEKINDTLQTIADNGLPSNDGSLPTSAPLTPEKAPASVLLPDNGQVKGPAADAGVPVLNADKKRNKARRARKAVQPIRISNRIEIRNINKGSRTAISAWC